MISWRIKIERRADVRAFRRRLRVTKSAWARGEINGVGVLSGSLRGTADRCTRDARIRRRKQAHHRHALSARAIRTYLDGSPFQPGGAVRVIGAVDRETPDVSSFVGREGFVEYLDFSCGGSEPDDPMIGVRFQTGTVETFWAEELDGAR